ncbi:vacuolar protein sorting-associated protein 16 homolog [Tetranychus urticae]|uniref:Vacuolar protein sorting-associated protein 16 homolog n=1 Tax=Tetranychus urticae TaxID=32264 RepID=T1K1H1_TETUR|nr:vacuolar protein sorting-associated protein 16 homolog [Tetranychus urticae]
MSMLTADWNPLGRDFYRRVELCSLNWSTEGVDLSKYRVCAAPFSGYIALHSHEKENATVRLLSGTNQNARSIIFIFTPYGEYFTSLRLKTSNLIAMGWSNTESLVCVGDNGYVYVYDFFGELQNSFLIHDDLSKTEVCQCKIFTGPYSTGIAVLTETQKFYVINNIDSPMVRQYHEMLKTDKPPSCWNVIACKNGEVKILFSRDGNLFQLSSNKCESMVFQRTGTSTVIDISFSHDYKNISLYLETGILWIGSYDGTISKICEFVTKCEEKPEYMLWCGNEAVVCLWKEILLLVGLEKDWLNYLMDGPVHLVQEIDGIRVITNDTNEIIQKVPDPLVQVFKIGSLAPGALLMEANKEYERRVHKANEYIRLLSERNEINSAVIQCTLAAAHEFQVSSEKMLLRAASFGKLFTPDADSELFVNICRNLRILNTIRQQNVGLLLTYNQLEYLSIQVLIDRLVLRRQYFLAIKIAKYLKIPDDQGVSRILRNWAFYKIKLREMDDAEIAQDIIKKIDSNSGVSFSEIAEQAIKEKRDELAILLLNCELKASRQVPLLLELKQYEQACKKASESGNADLIYMVIDVLSTQSRKDFLLIIRKHPEAYALYKKQCQNEDLEKLYDICIQEDDSSSRAYLKILEAYRYESIGDRRRCLLEAQECFRRAKNEFNLAATEEQLKLMENQIKLEEKFKHPFVGLSLQETMAKLLYDKEHKLAEGLKKDFKVPDRRFWLLKINILAEQRDWNELEKFSKSKKSPIGYEPFVSACLKFKNRTEAQKYVGKVREEFKVDYYVKTGLLEDAAKIAFMAKDVDALDYVAKRCGPGDKSLSDRIVSMRKQLTG